MGVPIIRKAFVGVLHRVPAVHGNFHKGHFALGSVGRLQEVSLRYFCGLQLRGLAPKL